MGRLVVGWRTTRSSHFRGSDAGGEVAGPDSRSSLTPRIRPKLSVKAGSTDYRAREQGVNFDLATSINSCITSRHLADEE